MLFFTRDLTRLVFIYHKLILEHKKAESRQQIRDLTQPTTKFGYFLSFSYFAAIRSCPFVFLSSITCVFNYLSTDNKHERETQRMSDFTILEFLSRHRFASEDG